MDLKNIEYNITKLDLKKTDILAIKILNIPEKIKIEARSKMIIYVQEQFKKLLPDNKIFVYYDDFLELSIIDAEGIEKK